MRATRRSGNLDRKEEPVIESISSLLKARIVSSLVVGGGNNEPEAERNEYLCSCVNPASGADVSEAAVLDCIVEKKCIRPTLSSHSY
jgi:hypothetical protein